MTFIAALSIPTADASTPAPDIGNVGQLEQALHRAVFAIGPVQHRKHDIQTEAGHDRLFESCVFRVRAPSRS